MSKIKKALMAFFVVLAMVLSVSPTKVYADGEDSDSTVVVYVEGEEVTREVGNVTVSGGIGVAISVYDGGTGTVSTKNVSSDYQDAVDVIVYGEGSTLDLTVNGDVTSDTDYGLDFDIDHKGEAKATIIGDIEGAKDGIEGYAGANSSLDITVEGNLHAGWYGFFVEADGDNSKVNINVTGDIYGEDDGIELFAGGDKAEVTANIIGNVETDTYTGVYVDSWGSGVVNASIEGNVTANNNAEGIYAYATDEGTTNNVAVIGDLTTEDGNALSLITFDSGMNNIYIDGDVTSGSGAMFYKDGGEGINDVLITGTFTSTNTPIELNGEASSDNTKFTVWKIETEAEGALSNKEEFDQTIKYIVKVEQPEKGGTIKAVNDALGDLEKSHNYDIAYEGDKVVLLVEAEEGYRIVNAYNGEGKEVELYMDSDGNYYIDVPKGGGIYLSVELEAEEYTIKFVDEDGTELDSQSLAAGETPVYGGTEPSKKADDEYTYEFDGWTPEIDVVTGDITYTAKYKAVPIEYELTFDLGGGTLDGQTGSITLKGKYGDTIKLPGAPTKEGYTFSHWEGSRYDAGADYKVEGAHSFTAVWVKEAPAPTPDVPNTAVMNDITVWTTLMGLSSVAGLFLLKRKED